MRTHRPCLQEAFGTQEDRDVSVNSDAKGESQVLKQLSSDREFSRFKVNICYFSIALFGYRRASRNEKRNV